MEEKKRYAEIWFRVHPNLRNLPAEDIAVLDTIDILDFPGVEMTEEDVKRAIQYFKNEEKKRLRAIEDKKLDEELKKFRENGGNELYESEGFLAKTSMFATALGVYMILVDIAMQGRPILGLIGAAIVVASEAYSARKISKINKQKAKAVDKVDGKDVSSIEIIIFIAFYYMFILAISMLIAGLSVLYFNPVLGNIYISGSIMLIIILSVLFFIYLLKSFDS